jgi:hypothetical protein
MENTDDESSSGGSSIVSGWTSMYTEDNCVDIGSSNEDESDFEPYSSNGKNNMEDNYSDNDDDDCDSVASGKTDCSIPAAPKKQKKKVASAASSSSKKYANILQEETDFIPE